jgi:hypothetical protein
VCERRARANTTRSRASGRAGAAAVWTIEQARVRPEDSLLAGPLRACESGRQQLSAHARARANTTRSRASGRAGAAAVWTIEQARVRPEDSLVAGPSRACEGGRQQLSAHARARANNNAAH